MKILVLGSPRSGTHYYGHLLSKEYQNLKYIGEVESIENIEDNTISHFVHSSNKTKYVPYGFDVHILRRRDKVKQFRSWLYFDYYGHHSGKNYTERLPISTIDEESIDIFVTEQMLDSFFLPLAKTIVYYEDIIGKEAKITKNTYIEDERLYIDNWDDVCSRLERFKYLDE